MQPKLTDFQKRMIEDLMAMDTEELARRIISSDGRRRVPATEAEAKRMNPDMYAALTAADAAPVGTVAVTKVGDQMVVATKSAAYISNVGG